MDFLKHVISFFTDREHPLSAKVVGATMFVVAILLLDNIFGISFYYSTKLKIEQLQAIKDLRRDNNEPKLTVLLNETEKQILERKNVVQIFLGLFTKKKIDSVPNLTPDTVYITKHDTIFVDKHAADLEPLHRTGSDDSRSQLWHTISSSYFLIMIFGLMPFMLFMEKRFSWTNLVATLFGMALLAGFIWLNQFLYGLIPLILGKPWINYTINGLGHSLELVLFIYLLRKSDRK